GGEQGGSPLAGISHLGVRTEGQALEESLLVGWGAGVNSLQEIVGCEIREDNHAWGFRFLYYDGERLLSCHPETHRCTVPQSLARNLAMEMEKSWDTDGFQSKYYQAHVEGELCGRLRGYLESWTGFRERTGPPAVNVTRSQDLEGTVNLTCWAFGFFPQNISVAWFWDEEHMSQEAQRSGGVLPDGNGTYRTWVTIRVPQGEEQRVECHVEHSGNHGAHTAPSGKTLVHQSQWRTILGVAAFALVFIIGLCVLCCTKKKTASTVGSPEPLAYKTWINARWSQVTIMASHNWDFSPRCQTLRPSVPLGELRICRQSPVFSSLFWSY
ncbi:MHC class I polypeptide-related sequence B-like, partial [Physeter macrocephalus]|uniref:MHC class I polypeptide-related sequence B-like n=1 Tax=Physeter macrocephalus TaxID=9755 RepID=A0A2Y9S5G1_PHYMC